MRRGIPLVVGLAIGAGLPACTADVKVPARTERMKVSVSLADGTALPAASDTAQPSGFPPNVVP